jgi:AraC-like DNA-binding protein
MGGPKAKQLGTAPSTIGTIARLAFALAEEKGADVETLLKKSGLSRAQIHDLNARLKVRSEIKFLELVAEAVGDDRLGFHLSQEFDLREIGLLYYVFASANRLDEALRYASRYSSIVNEGIKLTFRETRSEIAIAFEYCGVPRHLDRHLIEFRVATLIRWCRKITNRQLTAERVSFVHRCKVTPELSAFFNCDIRFGARVDEATFSPSIRDIIVVSGDPYLNRVLIKYCEEALAHRQASRVSFRLSVENTIALLMPHGKAQAGEVARKLGMSQRTVARRLASEGLKFAGVLQELRYDLAKRHLADTELSISQIAWLLGYHDVSAFTAAFKRWTGKTPHVSRQKLLQMPAQRCSEQRRSDISPWRG